MLEDARIEDPWYRIASRIEKDRTRLGLTRRDLADRVGVSRSTIFNWESGRRIPVEKCATIAAALGIAPTELLELHPEVPMVTRADAPRPASSREAVRLTRREVLFVAFGISALAVGIGFAAWMSASTRCFTIGAGLPSSSAQFRQAYDDAGGHDTLGCAIDEIHRFGPGIAQHFEGRNVGTGAIMSLDRGEAFVLAGEAYAAFRWIADGSAPDVAGHPIAAPRRCGDTLVLTLSGGAAGAGALVETADGSGYVWMAGGAWPAFIAAGGPIGPLGAPMTSTWDDDGFAVEFARGSISAGHGEEPVITGAGTTAAPLDLSTCAPASPLDAATL
ncbi:MAG: helix-turn-helix domain-containing protein [Acidimicrobiia bacterium]|nr:helix-turn-helix domain-containing protein [Acidimicrobiia bacterium]